MARKNLWAQLLLGWVLVSSFKAGAMAIWAFTFSCFASRAIRWHAVAKNGAITARPKVPAVDARCTFFTGSLGVVLIFTGCCHLAHFLHCNYREIARTLILFIQQFIVFV